MVEGAGSKLIYKQMQQKFRSIPEVIVCGQRAESCHFHLWVGIVCIRKDFREKMTGNISRCLSEKMGKTFQKKVPFEQDMGVESP